MHQFVPEGNHSIAPEEHHATIDFESLIDAVVLLLAHEHVVAVGLIEIKSLDQELEGSKAHGKGKTSKKGWGSLTISLRGV